MTFFGKIHMSWNFVKSHVGIFWQNIFWAKSSQSVYFWRAMLAKMNLRMTFGKFYVVCTLGKFWQDTSARNFFWRIENRSYEKGHLGTKCGRLNLWNSDRVRGEIQFTNNRWILLLFEMKNFNNKDFLNEMKNENIENKENIIVWVDKYNWLATEKNYCVGWEI